MTTPITPPITTPTTPANDPPIASSAPTPTGGGDTPPVATEPAGTEATPPTPPTDTVDEWANFDAERAKQTIMHQRAAEKKLKDELAAERKKVEAFEREKLTDAERLQADLATAQRERDEALKSAADLAARQSFDLAATNAGVLSNALAAARTIAAEVAATDDTGSMVVDDTLFASLKANHGYLFATQQAAPPRVTFGAALSQGPGGSPTSLTPEQVAFAQKAGIAPEDFAKHSVRTV